MSEPQCATQIAGKYRDGASRVGSDWRYADKYQRGEGQKGAASRDRVQYTCGECGGGKNGLVDHKSSLRNTVKNDPKLPTILTEMRRSRQVLERKSERRARLCYRA